MMEKTHFFDELFFYLSKIVVIIPIVAIIVVLVFKLGEKRVSVPAKKTENIFVPTVANLPKVDWNNFLKRNASGEAVLNFGGPFYCSYSFPKGSIIAQIKDDKAFVQIKINDLNNLLLDNDCIYLWETGRFTGQKICGIAGYLPMLQMFGQFNPSGVVGIASLIPSMVGKNAEILKEIDVNSLMKSCRKQKLNEQVFKIPTHVLFKNENSTKVPRP